MGFIPQLREQPQYIINILFQSLWSEQYESGHNFEIKFCDLSFILWEQVSFVIFSRPENV